MAEKVQEKIEECEKTEKRAAELAKQGYFVQSVDLLTAVTFVDHSQLKEVASRFERLSDRYRRQREQATNDADRVLEETRELERSGHLREALRAAKQVPPALRGRELRGLHDSLEERLKLATRLRAEIKEGLQSKSYGGLLDKAERLGELEPWDTDHRKLIAKLRKKQGRSEEKIASHYLEEAREHLKDCEYRKAEASLAQVPLHALNDKTRDTFRRRREKVWLANQAARAPYLTEATIAVVDRLVESQPHDERAKQLASSMRRRREKAMRESPGRPIQWTQPRRGKERALTFEHTGCAAILADELGKRGLSPGQFLPAFGLALQGVGRAEHVVDLALPAKSVVGRIASATPKRAAKSAWGIDLGSHSLKAIRVSLDPDSEFGLKLDAVSLVVHDSMGVADSDADTTASVREEARASLDAFMEENSLKGERVVIGLPGAQTLGRFFALPYLSSSKFAKAVQFETRARIPVAESEVQSAHITWDVEDSDGDAEVAQKRVALVAATNQHIEARTSLIVKQKPARIEVTSNCLALANATQFDSAALGIDEEERYAVVSIGAHSSDVVVSGGGTLWFRGLYGGASSFDRALVKCFGMSWSVAEKTRRKLDRAEWMYEIDEALEPEFEELSEAVSRAVQQYAQESGRRVTRVLICGGPADQFGLIRTLRNAAQATDTD